MTASVISPVTAPSVSFACTDDPFYGASQVRKERIGPDQLIEFKERNFDLNSYGDIFPFEPSALTQSTEFSILFVEHPHSSAVFLSAPIFGTHNAPDMQDPFEYLDDPGFRMPPKRHYRSRIYIRKVYRAVPKNRPDEWMEEYE